MATEQDWTTAHKTALVLDILDGKTSVNEAATRHGLSVTDVETWRALYLAAARSCVSAGQPSGARPGKARRFATIGAALLVAGFALFGSLGVLLADEPCVDLGNSELCVFSAGAPAHASEVNANFAKLKAWLENKVGSASSPDVTIAGNTSLAGPLSVNANAGVAGSLTVNASAGVAGNLSVNGRADVGGDLRVNGRIQAMHMELCECEQFGSYNLFQQSQWYACPNNKVLTGIYSTGGPNPACGKGSIECLEFFSCCRVCGFAAH